METQEGKHSTTLLTEYRMKQGLGSVGNSRNNMSMKRLGITVFFLLIIPSRCGLNCVPPKICFSPNLWNL